MMMLRMFVSMSLCISFCMLVKEELCESVVEIHTMMTMCLIFGEKMIQVICVYAPQSKKPDIKKDKLYDELVHEWI